MMSKENKSADNIISTDSTTDYHIPVMLHECIEALKISPDGVYVDCTFGGGGHSKEILKHLGTNGKLYVFDQDSDAMKNVPNDDRIHFIQQNFRHLKKFLRVNKITAVDGILADLGVSSHQFDEAERGFSIRFDADLDMRMDHRQALTAAHILETYNEKQLQLVFEKYGEVSNAKTLARIIVSNRMVSPIKTISQFKQSINQIVKGNPNKYLAKVFQALRIEVNDEIGALKEMLEQTSEMLKPGGRIAVITFHSLEDRIVKNFFKTGSIEALEVDDVFGTRPECPLTVVSKKPIVGSDEELKRNSRSRSAKLRVAEKK